MRKNDITVIIPTFNCAQFITRAIDSVLSQDIDNLYIIIIDDASNDNTLDILNNYIKNPKLKVIKNKINKKLGATRNIGIDNCTSEYLFFLDSDDWIIDNSLLYMRNIADQTYADVVASGVTIVDEKGTENIYYAYDYECTEVEEALERFSKFLITAPACAKLYRRSFIEKHALRFIEQYWHEDIIFTAYVAKYCKKYISISNLYYKYYVNNLSITKGKQTSLHIKSYFFIYKELIKFIHCLDKDKIGNEELYQKLFRNYWTLEFLPKFERYASNSSPKKFHDDIFAAAKSILGINGYPLADIICSLYENITQN